MQREPHHIESRTTYVNSLRATRAADRDPNATGQLCQLITGRWVYLIDPNQTRAQREAAAAAAAEQQRKVEAARASITIADLAQFTKTRDPGYINRTLEMLHEYRHERATEMESDIHDRWARIRFADGSELVITDDRMYPNNRHAVDWSGAAPLVQMQLIEESLRPH
jgi:hypothetical protein